MRISKNMLDFLNENKDLIASNDFKNLLQEFWTYNASYGINIDELNMILKNAGINPLDYLDSKDWAEALTYNHQLALQSPKFQSTLFEIPQGESSIDLIFDTNNVATILEKGNTNFEAYDLEYFLSGNPWDEIEKVYDFAVDDEGVSYMIDNIRPNSKAFTALQSAGFIDENGNKDINRMLSDDNLRDVLYRAANHAYISQTSENAMKEFIDAFEDALPNWLGYDNPNNGQIKFIIDINDKEFQKDFWNYIEDNYYLDDLLNIDSAECITNLIEENLENNFNFRYPEGSYDDWMDFDQQDFEDIIANEV